MFAVEDQVDARLGGLPRLGFVVDLERRVVADRAAVRLFWHYRPGTEARGQPETGKRPWGGAPVHFWAVL